MKHLDIKYKWLPLLILCSLSACYEDQQGCLDILASNYDVTADTECEDCCTYPQLVLNLQQEANGESFSLGDTITNNLGIDTRVLKVVYLLSNVSITIDGEVNSVSDSVQLIKSSDTIWVRDDFARVSRLKARYEIGELRKKGFISALQFHLGLAEIVSGASFGVGVRNDLNTDPDSLRQSDGSYIVQRLYLGVGPELTDSVVIDVPGALGTEVVAIELDTTFAAGRNTELRLIVDYGKWFDDIDFVTDDRLDVAMKLKENLPKCFVQ